MEAADVIRIYSELDSRGVSIWIDGGWAVDALLGSQTRPHRDLDIAIAQADLSALLAHLTERGFSEVGRDQDWNFVMGDGAGREIDVHVFVRDANGDIVDGIRYPGASLTGVGEVAGVAVRTIAAAYLVEFHTGYELTEKDYRDVSALCKKFGLELPEDYARFARED